MRPRSLAPAITATLRMPSTASTRGSTTGSRRCAANSAAGVASAQASSTRWSKASVVWVAQPSRPSRPITATQPVTISSIRIAAALRPRRTSPPGKVIANTSSARIRQAPSKVAPKKDTAAAKVPIATSGSSAACSSGPGPGWLRIINRVRVSRVACKAQTD